MRFATQLPLLLLAAAGLLTACQSAPPPTNAVKVIAVESFLTDMTQQVAGERLKVETLIPVNVDPHAFEPTPRDIIKISDSQVLVVNGGGLETWLTAVLNNTAGQHEVIEAARGIPGRTPGVLDPHFWMDPSHAVTYVGTIRDGLIQADPAGKSIYTQNASRYISQLKDLDAWISTQVKQIPPEKRLGYFADRYGFKVVGTIIPSISTDAAPSAQDVAKLITLIRQTGSPAVFLEMGANADLARQIASETDVHVITGLYTESVTDMNGPAPSYIDMLKLDTRIIVDALK